MGKNTCCISHGRNDSERMIYVDQFIGRKKKKDENTHIRIALLSVPNEKSTFLLHLTDFRGGGEFDFLSDKSNPPDLFPEHQFILSKRRGICVMAESYPEIYTVGSGHEIAIARGNFAT